VEEEEEVKKVEEVVEEEEGSTPYRRAVKQFRIGLEL
jgi:hypothetical protein